MEPGLCQRPSGYGRVMTTLVIILAIAATVAVVAWFLLNRKHPDEAADHGRRGQSGTVTTSEQLYETADRPAGPDAETMDPDQLGGDHRPPT
jgi:hypothetical protein